MYCNACLRAADLGFLPGASPSSPFLLPTFLWQGGIVVRATALCGTSSYSSPGCDPNHVAAAQLKPARCFIFPRSDPDLGLVLCLSVDGRPASFLFPPKAHGAANSLAALEKRDSEESWGRTSVFIQKCSLVPGGLQVAVSSICVLVLLWVLAGCPSVGRLALAVLDFSCRVSLYVIL